MYMKLLVEYLVTVIWN